jgi:gamma-glutamyltranspeptidase/glutathione hydrolase
VLNVLEGFDLGQLGHNSPETLHLIAEALKLGFSDRHHFYGDPRHVDVPIAGLLDKGYATERRQQIDPRRAWAEMPPPGDPWLYEGRRPSLASDPRRLEAVYGPSEPDTSYVCAVDQEGNAFSATPSDGVTGTPLVPDLGVIISSRGYQSWLEPEHPSAVAPGKRPRLTPSPGLVLKDGDLVMPFGTPGHDVQPQAMVQFLVNLIDFGLAPQEAVEAPRIATYSHPETGDPHVYFPGVVRGESRLGDALDGLAARGHRVERWPARMPTAGAICAILADRQRGVLVGAADPRRMSYAIGW